MWTDQIARPEVQIWLGTKPGPVDGVVIQSASELGAVGALLQSGRPMPSIAIGACNLNAHAGEVHTNIGRNGSGKSTLAKMISGVLIPDSG